MRRSERTLHCSGTTRISIHFLTARHQGRDSNVDWKLFSGREDGNDVPNDNLEMLPAPPPWRFGGRAATLARPKGLDLDAEQERAKPFLPTEPMILAVNLALYLRRPLLLT